MAIVGNYNMWWRADSMIGVGGVIGILGILMVIAASLKLNGALQAFTKYICYLILISNSL
jgi:hypothetical protein